MVASANMCLRCKGGKHLCGHNPCPLLAKVDAFPKMGKQLSSKDYFGPSSSTFVGHSGYPNVYVGPLGAIQNKDSISSPEKWFGKSYQNVIEMRSMIVRSKKSQSVYSKSNFVEENQLLSMAKKPTDIEMEFKNKPTYRMSFSDVNEPMGASASLKKLKLTQNVKIDHRIEYIIEDELKAKDQITRLYNRADIYQTMNILSSGALGEKRKRMVPTRWGITAVDDTLAKEMIVRIRNYKQLETFLVFESEYLNNRFFILMMPGNWEYENFEAWAPGSTWAQQAKEIQVLEEYEPFSGRVKYAELEGGGYYAARLGVCEALDRMKRQARVVVFL